MRFRDYAIGSIWMVSIVSFCVLLTFGLVRIGMVTGLLPNEPEVITKAKVVERVVKVEVPTLDNQAPAVIEGCPTEDSCRIDYHDGRWYITPQVP